MTDPPIRIRCVVAGDSLASPLVLVQRMRAYWAKKGLLSSSADVPVPAVSLFHPNGKALVHITFTVVTVPPRVLVTGVDMLISVFSPSHPLSFLHVWDMWWPIFSHLRHLPHFLVASRMELLMMPEVHALMHEKAICPIRLDEVMTAVSELPSMSFDDVIPLSFQDEDCVRHSEFTAAPSPLMSDFCDTFLLRCCGLPTAERMPLSSRWEAALDEALALQLEARLLPEWADFRSAASGRVFFANRRTGAVTLVRPSTSGDCAFHKGGTVKARGASQWPTARLSEMEEAVAELRETRRIVGEIHSLRKEMASREATRRRCAEESDELTAQICCFSEEQRELLREAEPNSNAGPEETEESLAEVTRVARCGYLAVWERNSTARAEVSARFALAQAAARRAETLRKKIRSEVDAPLAQLRRRIAVHHAALEEMEQSCFVLEQSRALGLHSAVPQSPQSPQSPQEWRALGQSPSQSHAAAAAARGDPARMDLLRAMHAAMTRTVAPLLYESDALRRVWRRHMRRTKSARIMCEDKLCVAERWARRGLQAEATLWMVDCIVDGFLLPALDQGRCIAESLQK